MLPQTTTTDAENRSQSGDPPRALVMDDDPLFRTLLVAMLKRDYSVAVAADGSEGFYKALETPPAIAVVDIQMPGWDGLRTIKAFRDHNVLQRIPLLVLSSDATRGTVLAAISAGADDYVIKSSFTREELLQKLRTLRGVDVVASSVCAESTLASCGSDREVGTATSSQRSQMDRVQEAIDAWE